MSFLRHENCFYIGQFVSFRLMFNNALTGTIPSSVGNLRKLSLLYLSQNLFTGTVPKEMESLSLLEALNLEDNEVEGPIILPKSEPFLCDLRIGKNKFTGEFPDLSAYSNLQFL